MSCYFFDEEYQGFTCDVSVENPNHLSNFTEITGTHFDTRNDDDLFTFALFNNLNSTTFDFRIVCAKFVNVKRMQFDFAGLELLDEDTFSNCNLNNITLRYSKLSELPENVFNRHPDMRYIDLQGNYLSHLPKNIFTNLNQIHMLALHNNIIEELPDGIFDSLYALEELLLYGNRITHLQHDLFKNLQNLYILDLTGNLLTEIEPRWLANLPGLGFIFFDHNKFKEIPKDLFAPTPLLFDIYLDNNQIRELPRGIFSPLKQLTFLSMNNNHIKIIHSDMFSIHPELYAIGFSNNEVFGFDTLILNYTVLTHLTAQNNPCIPEDVDSIRDTSQSKSALRAALLTCFNNYILRDAYCNDERLDERVCELEVKENAIKAKIEVIPGGNVLLRNEIQSLKDVENGLKDDINNINSESLEVESNLNVMKGEIETFSDDFNSKTKTLEDKIKELIEKLKENHGLRAKCNIFILLFLIFLITFYLH